MIKGNLKYPTFPILLNSVSASTFNVFYDSIEAQYKLMFPESGMTIAGTDATRTLNLSKTYAGSKQLKEIILNPAYPGETLNYETGFDIKVKQRDPGVHNDNFYPQIYHVSAKLPSLGTALAGKLSLADQKSIKNQLFESAKLSATEGAFNVYVSTNPITTSLAGASAIVLTFADGSADVTITDTFTSVAAINANATMATYGYAMLTGSGIVKFVFTYQTKCIHSIAITGANPSVTAEYTNLVIASSDPMKQAFVEVGSDLGTVSGFSYCIGDHYHTSNAGISGLRTVVVAPYTGTSESYFASTSVSLANLIIALNSAFTDANAYATLYATGGTKYILYSPYILIVDYYPLPSAVGSITTLYSGTGVYPSMTGDDIWRVFANNAHDGEFANLHYVDKPDTSTEYILVHLVNTLNTGGQHIASGYGGYQQEIRAYVKASEYFKLIYGTVSLSGATGLLAAGTSKSMNAILEEVEEVNGLYVEPSSLTSIILELQQAD